MGRCGVVDGAPYFENVLYGTVKVAAIRLITCYGGQLVILATVVGDTLAKVDLTS